MTTLEDPLRRDFRVFLFVVWRHLGLPAPTPVQYDIARYLQTGPRRKMVMAFRGVGKSWIYAAFACWRLYRDPERKIIVVSATKALADSIAQFMKRLIGEIAPLGFLRPRAGQRDSASAFDVGPARASKDPSVRSIGINGQITGSRADEILADDVEALNNSFSQEARRKLREQIREFDAVLKPGGVITYLGTPQSFDSIYLALPDRGYEVRIWPAETPPRLDPYRGRLAPFVLRRVNAGSAPGEPLDPKRFPIEDLAARRASYGRAGYALQFMLDTTQTDALRHPLKLSDLIALDLAPGAAPPSRVRWGEDAALIDSDLPALGFPGDRFRRAAEISPASGRFARAVMAIDPSGRGADETGYAVVKCVGAQLYLCAAGGLAGGYEDAALRSLAEIARAERVDEIVIEANFGDGMFARLLTPHLAAAEVRARVAEQRAGAQKEARIIDTLEPVTTAHRLVVLDAVIAADSAAAERSLNRSLFFQLTRLTRDRGALAHDDRLDALALAVSRFADALDRGVEAAERLEGERAERHAARALKRAMRGGVAVARRRWRRPS